MLLKKDSFLAAAQTIGRLTLTWVLIGRRLGWRLYPQTFFCLMEKITKWVISRFLTHSCLAKKLRIGAAQWKNAFFTFWHEIPNTSCLFGLFDDLRVCWWYLVVTQWLLVVVIGYGLFPRHCQIADVMQSRFIILRQQKHIIVRSGCTKTHI